MLEHEAARDAATVELCLSRLQTPKLRCHLCLRTCSCRQLEEEDTSWRQQGWAAHRQAVRNSRICSEAIVTTDQNPLVLHRCSPRNGCRCEVRRAARHMRQRRQGKISETLSLSL